MGKYPSGHFEYSVAGRLRFLKCLEPITFQARQMASWPCVGIEGGAKVRIQGNWLIQTASLPPRPPMQGAGYGPPATPPSKTWYWRWATGDNAVTYYPQSLYNAEPPSRSARHPATMTGHR